LESRYALRETEGAIGYDCRLLSDGRRALFRHTALHARSRREFLERRDTMLVLTASMVSNASLLSNPRLDPKLAADIVSDIRSSLLRTAFPYLSMGDDENKEHSRDTYDEYFDELDAIEKAEVGEKAKNTEKHDDSHNEGIGEDGATGPEMI